MSRHPLLPPNQVLTLDRAPVKYRDRQMSSIVQSYTPMDYKLTIDIGLLREKTTAPAIETLMRWQEEGKIKLVEAEPPRETSREPAFGWPGAPKTSYSDDSSLRKKRKSTAGESTTRSNFNSVAGVMFPGKNSQKLSMGEINDVAHLVKHQSSRNEIFVTANSRDFIDGGKRERLKSGFGILAMTPKEAVEMLSKMEGWK